MNFKFLYQGVTSNPYVRATNPYIKTSSLRFSIELLIPRSGANPCARAINLYIKGIESLHQSAVTYIKSLHQGVKVSDFYSMLGASIEVCEIKGYVHV